MWCVWSLSLLLVLPVPDRSIRESHDLVESNWFYDDNGKEVFQQIIWYDFSYTDWRYQVVAWRLVKSQTAGPVPRRDWDSGGYISTWYDGEVFRVVRASEIRETWTQWDVELIEREKLPKEFRKELRPSRSMLRKVE